MKTLILIFSVGFFLRVGAQGKTISKVEASVLIKKINTEMSLPKNYSADIEYLIFKSHIDTMPLDVSKGFYKRNGLKEHSLMVGIETIQNDKVRLVVDTSSQSIVLSKSNPKIQFVEDGMLAALSMCKSFVLIKYDQFSVLQLVLDPNSGIGFSKLEISFFHKTHYMKNITMYYNSAFIPHYEHVKTPKVSINYSNISTSRISNDEFKTDRFIYIRNNTYFLNSLYKEFNLFNQLLPENN